MKLASQITALALLLATQLPVQSQVTWNGSGGNNNWSTNGNWSGGTPPNNSIIFNNTDPTTQANVNNIVDQNYTIASLSYTNTGTNWQVTQISENVTLTLDAAVAPTNILSTGTLGTSSSYVSTTNAMITGDGKLTINESSSNILVSTYTTGASASTAPNGQALLNMSGLGAFEASVNQIRIGYGRASNSTMYLARANTISAAAITIGSSEWTGSSSIQNSTSSSLFLGQSNTINVTDLLVGSNLTGTSNKNANSGTLSFASGLDGAPAVVLRGLGSTPLAPVAVSQMIVGNIGGNTSDGVGGSFANSSMVDFTGGSVDALVTTLTIGKGNPGTSSSVSGTLKMDEGSFHATTVILGSASRADGTAGGTVTGTLEVGGGAFTAATITIAEQAGTSNGNSPRGFLNVTGGLVETTGNLVVGNKGTATSATFAQVDLSGGTLKVGGNLAEGTGANNASTLLLRGGTLDMDGGNITVDTFTVESGTLQNLNQFNSGGGINKTTSGTLILAGTNSYTGTTAVNGGTWQVIGTHSGAGSYTIGSAASLAGTGTITGATNANITIASGGSLKPGTTGSGILNLSLSGTGKLSFSNGSLLSLDAGDKISFDLVGNWLTVTSGALLDPTGGLWAANTAYTIFENITATPSTLWTLGNAAVASGYALDTSFGTGGFLLDGNNLQVRFASVPEPATVILIAIAGSVLFFRRRMSRI